MDPALRSARFLPREFEPDEEGGGGREGGSRVRDDRWSRRATAFNRRDIVRPISESDAAAGLVVAREEGRRDESGRRAIN